MLMTATVIGAQAQKETLNPWGLVYDGALRENVVGEVQIRPVTYMVDGISVSASAAAVATPWARRRATSVSRPSPR